MTRSTYFKVSKIAGLALATLLVSCGGTDPNDTATPAKLATCKVLSNWNLVQIGYSIENVVKILGQPNQVTATATAKTYLYEDCRIFYVEKTPDDKTTETNEFVGAYVFKGGTVTFTGGTGGYVSAINSPESEEVFIHELTTAEVLAFRR
jgi:hypothetical protein